MFLPVTTKTTGPAVASEMVERGQRCRCRGLDADPDLREAADRQRQLTLRHAHHALDDGPGYARPRTGSRRARRGRRRSSLHSRTPAPPPRRSCPPSRARPSRPLHDTPAGPSESLAYASDQSAVPDRDDDRAPALPARWRSRRRSRGSPRTAQVRGRRRTTAARAPPRTSSGGPTWLRRNRRRPTGSAPPPMIRASFASVACFGAKTTALIPSSRAAHAVAAPWLPVDAVTMVGVPRV